MSATKTIYFNTHKNRKMTEDDFRNYAASIEVVTGEKVTVRSVSNNNVPGNALEMVMGRKDKVIGGWRYLAPLGHGRGNYYLAA
jgi:hypothetical protein